MFENENKLIYVVVFREIYGMLVAAVLFYKKIFVYLENIEFEFNPYDPFLFIRIKVGSQHTVRSHVDGGMSSHVNPKVTGNFK